MKKLFKPEYGGPHYVVRPRRWWSRKERRQARLSATVANAMWSKHEDAFTKLHGQLLAEWFTTGRKPSEAEMKARLKRAMGL